MPDTKTLGRRVERSHELDHVARAGLVALGLVHLLMAWVCLLLVLGQSGGTNANAPGAMSYLAHRPFGQVLVWAVALGMFLLVGWLTLEAAFGHRGEDPGLDRWRMRASSAFTALVYAVLGGTALRVAIGAGASDQTSGVTARILDLPAGRWLLGLVGLVVVGVGIGMAVYGWREGFADQLDRDGRTGSDGRAYRLLGQLGFFGKGVAVGLVGSLFGYAALTHQGHRSGGLDQALHQVLQQPFGRVLVAVVAAGFAASGLFSFARVKHLNR